YLHSQLPSADRGRYFSLVQSVQQISLLCAPALAIALIHHAGIRWCFFIDAASYACASLAWLPLRSTVAIEWKPERQGSLLAGYDVLLNHLGVRSLGLFRIFNHFAYTTFTVAVPIWAARIASHTSLKAADLQGGANTMLALGTIGISLLGGAMLARNPHRI